MLRAGPAALGLLRADVSRIRTGIGRRPNGRATRSAGRRVVMLVKQMSFSSGRAHFMSNPSPIYFRAGRNHPLVQYGENATAAPGTRCALRRLLAPPPRDRICPAELPAVTLVIGVLLIYHCRPSIVLIMMMGMGITSAAESVGNEAILQSATACDHQGRNTIVAGYFLPRLWLTERRVPNVAVLRLRNNLHTAFELSSGTPTVDTPEHRYLRFNGDVPRDATDAPFVWATVVGVIGLILLMSVSNPCREKRRRPRSATMMSAICRRRREAGSHSASLP